MENISYSRYSSLKALIFQRVKIFLVVIAYLLFLEGCYNRPDLTACTCHTKEYRDTMLVYDSTQIIWIGDEYSRGTCDSYYTFSIIDLVDSTKWLNGDSSQLIKAYYTKCWDTEKK